LNGGTHIKFKTEESKSICAFYVRLRITDNRNYAVSFRNCSTLKAKFWAKYRTFSSPVNWLHHWSYKLRFSRQTCEKVYGDNIPFNLSGGAAFLIAQQLTSVVWWRNYINR